MLPYLGKLPCQQEKLHFTKANYFFGSCLFWNWYVAYLRKTCFVNGIYLVQETVRYFCEIMFSHFTEKYIPDIRDVFRDLLPFVQFKKRENYPWRSVTFFNIPGWSQQFSKSNISPFVFFHVFKIKLMLPNCAKHYGACQCKQDFTSLKHAVVVFKLFNFNSNLSQLFQYLRISKFICSNSGK